MSTTQLCECGCGQPAPLAKQTNAKRGRRQGEPQRFIGSHGRRVAIAPPNPSGLCQCGCGAAAPIATKGSRSLGHRVGHPVRFIVGHNAHRGTLLERFSERYTVNPETGCWEWHGGFFSNKAYGYLGVDGTPRMAHRVAYELFVGPIPEGLHIDHLCYVPRCVNPAHLEAVTPYENNRRRLERQTHCKHGHPLSGENLSLVRVCRTCRAATEARHIAKRRAERAA